MAQHAKRPAVARYIEPASRSRYDVMALQLDAPTAAHTPLAVTTQDERPQLAPPPR